MKYTNENEILEVIEKFKNGTIERTKWGHAEHLILAHHYLSNNDFETAVSKMREGIFDLLKSFEIDLKKEMPYHETLTIFWMKTVCNFIKSNNTNSLIKEIDALITGYDKNYPSKFYTNELLFSDEAKANFVESDKLPLIFQ